MLETNRVNPWARLATEPPYVLDQDRLAVEVFNRSKASRPDERIVLDDPPEPFLGCLDASVVVLLSNPGIGRIGVAKANLLSAIRDPETCSIHPWLTPDQGGSEVSADGYAWWGKLIKALVAVGDSAHIGRNLLSVEFFPYRSKSFGCGHVRLRSQEFGFELVRDAIRRSAAIVVARGWNLWVGAVPELAGYALTSRLKNPRSASLSAKNLNPACWERIQKVMRRDSGHPSN